MSGTGGPRAPKRVASSLAAALLATVPVLAQESASYRLREHAFNEGGHPVNGTVMTSASFTIRLDSIGDGAAATSPASASFHLSAGFGAAYPPPGEVQDVRFTNQTTIAWDPEHSAGDYNLYRVLIGDLPISGFGACQQSGIASPVATDADVPPLGTGFVYLAAVENLLQEEGTLGVDSLGHERPNAAPCP